MDCPKCNEYVGGWLGMSGNPDSDKYWLCVHCKLLFYYTKKGKLFIYNGTIKKWIQTEFKEIVIFT